MEQPTVFILQPFCFYRSKLRFGRACLSAGNTVDQAVPSAALLDGRVRPRILVQIRVRVVSMPSDEAVLCPPSQSVFVDMEALYHFLLRQQASVSEC